MPRHNWLDFQPNWFYLCEWWFMFNPSHFTLRALNTSEHHAQCNTLSNSSINDISSYHKHTFWMAEWWHLNSCFENEFTTKIWFVSFQFNAIQNGTIQWQLLYYFDFSSPPETEQWKMYFNFNWTTYRIIRDLCSRFEFGNPIKIALMIRSFPSLFRFVCFDFEY